jgi:hypothetical protein
MPDKDSWWRGEEKPDKDSWWKPKKHVISMFPDWYSTKSGWME